jgi:prolyl-tRNA synthetase
MKQFAISPLRSENFPEWYQQVVKEADLAENSDVRGCMVIKPWGYAIWENIQHTLDNMFKKVGIQNAYFPLFIPLKYLEKEAAHIEGFATQCAVVTPTRLQTNDQGNLIPASPFEEPSWYVLLPKRLSVNHFPAGSILTAICQFSSISGQT